MGEKADGARQVNQQFVFNGKEGSGYAALLFEVENR
jgi:hypothetical protein